jgi:hypothetical protein
MKPANPTPFARANASAKRKAEKAAWKRMIALDVECRRMALQIVKDEIRASGRKFSLRVIPQRPRVLNSY